MLILQPGDGQQFSTKIQGAVSKETAPFFDYQEPTAYSFMVSPSFPHIKKQSKYK